jgi:hypothetical protein
MMLVTMRMREVVWLVEAKVEAMVGRPCSPQ